MSFLDWLLGKMDCPRCGTRGAKEINGAIHCPNPACSYFSSRVGKGSVTSSPAQANFRTPASVPPGSVAIQYLDFRGKARTFIAEAGSAYRQKNHFHVKVAPKGARIVLSRDRIQNLSEVENALPRRVEPGQAEPSPRERQVLGYHKRHQSTSALYESTRARYPNW